MRAKSAVSSANTPDTASEMDPIIMRSDQIQAGGAWSGCRLESTHSGQRVTLWLEGSQEAGGVAHQWRQPGPAGGQATSATPYAHRHGIG